MYNIILNKNRSFKEINKDSSLKLELSSKSHLIPQTDLRETLDLTEEYNLERDFCYKNRLIFNIFPYMTNSLYNRRTEVVVGEGGENCTNLIYETVDKPENAISTVEEIDIRQAIRDTEYSHPDICGKKDKFVYHCGLDIFDNHRLRTNSFVNFSKPGFEKSDLTIEEKKDAEKWIFGKYGKNPNFKKINLEDQYDSNSPYYDLLHDKNKEELAEKVSKYVKEQYSKIITGSDEFNTISDYQRDANGNILESNLPILIKDEYENFSLNNERLVKRHVYMFEDIDDIYSAFSKRKTEDNGWHGFKNPSSLSVKIKIGEYKNEKEIYLNKLMNDNKSFEFIDFYPDRSLYSFLPKINKFKGREEYNWEYSIMYPYENDKNYFNEINFFFDNEHIEGETLPNGMMILDYEEINSGNGHSFIQFKTLMKHNLKKRDQVRFTYRFNPDYRYKGGFIEDVKKLIDEENKAQEDIDKLDEIVENKYLIVANKKETIPVLLINAEGKEEIDNKELSIGDAAILLKREKSQDSISEEKIYEYVFDLYESDNAIDERVYNISGDNYKFDKDIQNGFGEPLTKKENFVIHGISAEVSDIGDAKNEKNDQEHYFSVKFEAVEDFMYIDAANAIDKDITIVFNKIVKGYPCEYYFRKFKKLMNPDDNGDRTREINNENGRIAFSQTIFGDNNVQLLYNDSIDTLGVKDNRGRELTELYLNIEKTNKGHEKWYSSKPDVKDEDIEFSHCFGKITAGLDLPDYVTDYNVHKMHNIDLTAIEEEIDREKEDKVEIKVVVIKVTEEDCDKRTIKVERNEKLLNYKDEDEIILIINKINYRAVITDGENDDTIINFNSDISELESLEGENIFFIKEYPNDKDYEYFLTKTLDDKKIIYDYATKTVDLFKDFLNPMPKNGGYMPDTINLQENDEFIYGDIVEYAPSIDTETVIENVYHRFNTAQRECVENINYFDLKYDTIKSDDFGFFQEENEENMKSPFRVVEENDAFVKEDKKGIIKYFRAMNLASEGYYYKPLYKVDIRKKSDAISSSKGQLINCSWTNVDDDGKEKVELKPYYFNTKAGKYVIDEPSEGVIIKKNCLKVKSPANFGFSLGDNFLLYDRKREKDYWGKLVQVEDNVILLISFEDNSIKDIETDKEGRHRYNLIKANVDTPLYASYLNNTNQNFVWRETERFSLINPKEELYNVTFSNGCLYFENNISFFLRRQDPFGNYGVRNVNEGNKINKVNKYTPEGSEYETSVDEYVAPEDNAICS